MESKPERLEVGLEVEYTVFNRDKGGKVSAENVKLLRKVSFGFFQQLFGDKKNILSLKKCILFRELFPQFPGKRKFCMEKWSDL